MEINNLEEARKEIDKIDKEILSLFEKRMNLALETTKFKKKCDKPVLDSNREAAILDKIALNIENKELEPYAKMMFQDLMKISRCYQNDYLTKIEDPESCPVIIIGMPGAGKTTIGKLLSEQLAVEFIDTDMYIEEKHNTKISKLFEKGEDYFRIIESEALKDIIKQKPKVIATGGGIIKSVQNIELMKSYGNLVYIDRPIEDIINDIDVSFRPLLLEDKNRIVNLYKERKEIYESCCDYRVVNNKSIQHVIDNIIAIIKAI